MVIGMSTPSFPTSSANTSTPTRSTPPPGSVNGAFFIYLIAAAISLVGIVLTFTSDIWDRALRENADMVSSTGMTTEELINVTKTVSIVVGVLFVGLYLLFAFKMRAGRNWARIVLTVLSALSVVSLFSATASVKINDQTYTSGSNQVTGWIGAVISVLAIVLMFLPASNEYFARTKAERAAR